MNMRIAISLLVLTLATPLCWEVQAQSESALPAPQTELSLFAIEITVGPEWDASKPPQEQAYFQEHSAKLRSLRESGSLLLGARYSDKGLIVVAASSLEDARAMMDADPSIAAGTFVFEAHPFNVFYPGTVESRSRR